MTSAAMTGAAMTSAGLLAGVAADALLGDPRTGHPVAAFGRLAAGLEARMYANAVGRGTAYAGTLVGASALTGVGLARVTRRRPLARAGITASVTWAVLGGTSLAREATAMQRSLLAGDIAAARARLPHLCGRDPAQLDADGLARATVESVAENTSDAVVAPLLWGAVAGLPGLLAYRAVNTLDAMVGHRSPRYERFGRAAARLDDVANLGPARVTAALACALAPVVGGRAPVAWRVLRRDGAAHPSPNAGRCEAAFAGALAVRLGGRNVYGSRVESRPYLGDGAPPSPGDIARAVRLARAVGLAAAAGSALVAGRRWSPWWSVVRRR
jgi:adenosylcobinamide-phosphate synthase